MQRSLPVVANEGRATVRGTPAYGSAEERVRPASGPAGSTNRDPSSAYRPHVIAWNLTQRCNLACAHCYISAGSWHAAASELSTEECHRVVDEVLAETGGGHASGNGSGGDPAEPLGGGGSGAMLILSGGEPLLRDDLEEIAAHASEGGATVVVGTNGTRLTEARIGTLMDAGVRGVAVSVDSLNPAYHDRFRHGDGALDDTLAAIERLRAARLDFVVQTTLTRGNREELEALAAWAAEMGAVSFNLYFLVPTGRGERMQGLTPRENDDVLRQLARLQREYRGALMIRSKCQPQIMRHVFETDPDSPLLNYRTRCPCGVQYCRITPEGRVTPCPYTPVVAGDLCRQSFGEIWRESPVLLRIREGELGGKCGRCEYREICGGCRARAYAEEGDLMGPDNSCAYEPAGDVPLIERREVTYGAVAAPALAWSDEARERISRVPSFVRGVVVSRVEDFARERGYTQVTAEVMAEVRRSMPIDFSKRLPFFARNDSEPPDELDRTPR
jgi:AdoMet-dependent heme synthase